MSAPDPKRWPSPGRHPQGRTCGDKKTIGMVLLLMPYAIARYGYDCLRGRGGEDGS